jgi:hypothetical protein
MTVNSKAFVQKINAKLNTTRIYLILSAGKVVITSTTITELQLKKD